MGKDILNKLIGRKGLRVDAQDKQGLTALQWALVLGKEDIALALLKANANPSLPSKQGVYPVHSAGKCVRVCVCVCVCVCVFLSVLFLQLPCF